MSIDELVYDIEATIGINFENVLVSCCYEDVVGLPTIYKVIYQEIDIQGCLSEDQIDELEVYADQVLKTLFYNEKDEGKISQWERDQLSKGELN
jgi:hypothetical protein